MGPLENFKEINNFIADREESGNEKKDNGSIGLNGLDKQDQQSNLGKTINPKKEELVLNRADEFKSGNTEQKEDFGNGLDDMFKNLQKYLKELFASIAALGGGKEIKVQAEEMQAAYKNKVGQIEDKKEAAIANVDTKTTNELLKLSSANPAEKVKIRTKIILEMIKKGQGDSEVVRGLIAQLKQNEKTLNENDKKEIISMISGIDWKKLSDKQKSEIREVMKVLKIEGTTEWSDEEISKHTAKSEPGAKLANANSFLGGEPVVEQSSKTQEQVGATVLASDFLAGSGNAAVTEGDNTTEKTVDLNKSSGGVSADDFFGNQKVKTKNDSVLKEAVEPKPVVVPVQNENQAPVLEPEPVVVQPAPIQTVEEEKKPKEVVVVPNLEALKTEFPDIDFAKMANDMDSNFWDFMQKNVEGDVSYGRKIKSLREDGTFRGIRGTERALAHNWRQYSINVLGNDPGRRGAYAELHRFNAEKSNPDVAARQLVALSASLMENLQKQNKTAANFREALEELNK